MKKIFILLKIFTVVSSTAFAISGGNPSKGRALFKKSCKPCHYMHSSEGGYLSPSDKTMNQWDRFFKKGKHPRTVFDDLSEKEITDIWQFMFDFAADTDQPQSCDPGP
ncbi:cytochrome c [Malonomonas rubra]|uniref:cytochrome c n=1 Tax=Malonomonas rubra TaxID=57040 RepID=UPI0026F2DB93|nr:cytochrome c [Malonomonas rubra]